ncbi:MAG: hypothetical protein CL733_04715, partial [Chloroflexi bacterium]|nr:hypothetical protein [Chloroflexota bacterium]
GVDVVALIKGFRDIGFAVAVGVLKDANAIALGLDFAPWLEEAIIHPFGHPHAPLGVDVHVGRVDQHRLGGEQRGLEFRVRDELFCLLGGGDRAVALRGKIRRQREGSDNGQGRFDPVQFHVKKVSLNG